MCACWCASVCVVLWTCKAPFPQSIAGLLDSVWPRLLVAIRYTMKRRKSEHGARRSVSLVWQCSYSICIRNMWYEGNLDALTFGICYIFVHFFCCNSSFGSGHPTDPTIPRSWHYFKALCHPCLGRQLEIKRRAGVALVNVADECRLCD